MIEGHVGGPLRRPIRRRGVYGATREPVHILMKVETHNHPTAISPFPGAATGSGGEIRDEGATGRGGKPEGGADRLLGVEPAPARRACGRGRSDHGKPDRIACALDIMIDGPLGGAAFNNEFGRPNLCGYFRTFELEVDGPGGREVRGYHKPIMIAGGFGNVRAEHVQKGEIPPGAPIVVLGGPGDADRPRRRRGVVGGVGRLARGSRLRLGAARQRRDAAALPGGDRSLLGARRRQPDPLDPRRRRRRAVERAARAGARQPAAARASSCARSRATSRACRRSRSGATRRRSATCWRIAPERLARVRGAVRARALPVRRGRPAPPTTASWSVDDALLRRQARSTCRSQVLLGKPPQDDPRRRRACAPRRRAVRDRRRSTLREAAPRVLRLPTVADKTFLITIGDRTVGGLVARDQMVGPWQVPVADAAVTATGFDVTTGEAMAMGERTPVALLDAAASARHGGGRGDHQHRLARQSRASPTSSCRPTGWRAAGHPGEDARLYDAVRAVGVELCPALGIAIPVGKDSMSMRTAWTRRRAARGVTAPLSLIVQRLRARHRRAPRADAGAPRATPARPRCCWSISGAARTASAARRWPRSTASSATTPPDLDDPALLAGLLRGGAGAERRRACSPPTTIVSDGGLFVTLLEMAFAGGVGLDIDVARSAAIRSRRCSPRSWARCWRCAPPTSHGAWPRSARTAWPAASVALGARRGRRRSHHDPPRRPDAALDERRSVLRGIWSETTHAHPVAARRSDLRRRGAGGARRRDRSRAVGARSPSTSTRTSRRPCGRRARRAPAGRHPARAGGERSDRDGRRVRPGRLRGGRRAHERSARRAPTIWRGSAAWPPAAGSRTATCSARARAGRSRSCSTRARASVRGVLRPARHVHARRLQRLPDDVGAQGAHPRRRRAGRASCATAASGSRRALAMVAIEREPVDPACAGWPARGCRSPSRTARGARSSDRRRDRAALEAAGLVAARFVDHRGRADRALPREPERLARRHHRRSPRRTAA